MRRTSTASDLPSPDNAGLGDVWTTVKSSLPLLIVLTALAGVLTYVVTSLMMPRYSASTLIRLSNGDRDLQAVTGTPASERIDKEAVRSQVQVLQSRDLGLEVANDLKLATYEEFNDALSSSLVKSVLGGRSEGTEEQRVMRAFRERLQVFEVKDSRVIAVKFSAADPQLSADIANKLAKEYIARRKTTRVKTSKGASDWLVEEVAQLRREVAEAEQSAESFRATAGLLQGQNNTTLSGQQLAELTTQLSQAKSAASDAKTRAASLKRAMRLGSGVDAHPEVLKSALVQRLIEQQARVQRERSELSATLLPRHPRMRQLASELAGVRRQVRGEVRKIVSSIENEAQIASARVVSLQSTLDGLKSQVSASSEQMARMRVLEREAKSKRDLLETYLARLGNAKARRKEASVPMFAEIIQTATPASRADFPRKIPMTLLAMMATFLVGGGLATTKGLYLSARRAQSEEDEFEAASTVRAGDARARPAAIVAAAAPALAPDFDRDQHPQTSQIAGAEAFDRSFTSADEVAAYLTGLTQNVGGFRSIVSFEQDMADSIVKAMAVARSLVERGCRVLVIDWNKGESAIAAAVGATSRIGMRELIAGTAQREHVLLRSGEAGFDLITGGETDVRGLPHAAQKINLGFDQFDQDYDHVLVCGASDAMHRLFSLMEGRFDAGVVATKHVLQPHEPGVFLGYEVPDLAIARFEDQRRTGSAGLRAQFAPAPAPVTPAE